MLIGVVSVHFINLRDVKRRKTCVSRVNSLFWGTKVPKWFRNQSILSSSLDLKCCLGVFSGHFGNLRNVKIRKTCVSVLNALFRGTEVANIVSSPKDLFIYIQPKVMFASVFGAFWKHTKCNKMQN
jgi:hypothetical protein